MAVLDSDWKGSLEALLMLSPDASAQDWVVVNRVECIKRPNLLDFLSREVLEDKLTLYEVVRRLQDEGAISAPRMTSRIDKETKEKYSFQVHEVHRSIVESLLYDLENAKN